MDRNALLNQVIQQFGGQEANGGQQIAMNKVTQDLGYNPQQVALAMQQSANAINSSLPTSSSSLDFSTPTAGASASPSWEDFKNRAVKMAQQEHFPVSVLLGQAALESGRGSSNFAKNRNNYFGYMAYDSNPDAARSYQSPEQSIQDYIDLITKSPRYSQAVSDANDPVKMLQDIKGAGYATDPNYVSKVESTPEFQQYLNH